MSRNQSQGLFIQARPESSVPICPYSNWDHLSLPDMHQGWTGIICSDLCLLDLYQGWTGIICSDLPLLDMCRDQTGIICSIRDNLSLLVKAKIHISRQEGITCPDSRPGFIYQGILVLLTQWSTSPCPGLFSRINYSLDLLVRAIWDYLPNQHLQDYLPGVLKARITFQV